MKTAIVLARDADPARSWCGAFAKGLAQHGWKVTVQHDFAGEFCDLLVLWGTRRTDRIERQKASGGEVCILERGYVGDRKKWTSVSFGGGLNNRGIYRGPFHDPTRWQDHFADIMRPWRGSREGYALILGQVPGDMSIKDVNIGGFYAKAVFELSQLGFEVRFRPHPLATDTAIRGITSTKGKLADNLAGAALTVSFNSNSSVDAVLAGVPSLTMDKGTMAWHVTGHEYAFPAEPDREPWAHALAWKQWQLEEIASGECWAAVRMP